MLVSTDAEAARAGTDGYTDRQTDKTTTVTLAHACRGLIITVRHRSFSVQLAHVAGQFSLPMDKMAERKRCGSQGESSSASKRSRRQVTVATCEKWQREFDRDYQTLLWLRYDVDTANRSLVDTLWCEVCRTYQARIRYKRNFSAVWALTGSTNHKSSNIADHGKSEQHIACMAYMRTDNTKARNEPVESYAPIARSLQHMEDSEKEKMKRKFEICYVLAREGVAFAKYPTFHALAESQGVDIGSSYRGADCAKIFMHFIAESQRQCFLHSLPTTTKFFSFLMDGSTDAANTEVELVLVMYCCKDDFAREVRSCTRYLAVVNPTHGNADESLGRALWRIGLEDIHDRREVLGRSGPVLVGAQMGLL